jgi:hypothetical protein
MEESNLAALVTAISAACVAIVSAIFAGLCSYRKQISEAKIAEAKAMADLAKEQAQLAQSKAEEFGVVHSGHNKRLELLEESYRQCLMEREKSEKSLVELQEKFTEILDFLLRLASVELRQLRQQEKLHEAVSAICPQLRKFYRAESNGSTDGEMMMKIERQFGQWMIDRICTPYQIPYGACLLVALRKAKGEGDAS